MPVKDKSVLVTGANRGIGAMMGIADANVSTQDFSVTFTVDQTPGEAFAAINNVRGWWSLTIEGSTDKVGDVWTYRYLHMHSSKQRITKLVPGKKIEWLVLDGYVKCVENKTEWTGTTITFDIEKKAGKTEVRFTHVGLVPSYECYGACSSAWTSYINGSLRSLITTGKGEPNE
jgi:hypothetical protein